MNEVELKKWGLSITNEIYRYWQIISSDNLFIKQNGFEVFYSPIIYNPYLMIIGLNPGGIFSKSEEKFDPFSVIKELPKVHDYQLPKYDIAESMNEIFKFDTQLLYRSVKFNYYFFRSSCIEDLYRQRKDILNIHEFCSHKVKSVIKILQPKIILTEGITVFDNLNVLLEVKNINNPIYSVFKKKYRILQTSHTNNLKLIGMIHPTGRFSKRIFNKNKDLIIENLQQLLKSDNKS